MARSRSSRSAVPIMRLPQRNCLDRETALRRWTENVTWFSREEAKRDASRSVSDGDPSNASHCGQQFVTERFGQVESQPTSPI
jgi:hypothetical protein